jgi:hypothetical protein
MSSFAESIAFAAPSFMGRLLRPTDHEYDEDPDNFFRHNVNILPK